MKNYTKSIFTALLMLTTLAIHGQIVKTYYCSKDAALGISDGGNSNNNYGSACQNAAFGIPTGGSGNFNRAAFAFTLDPNQNNSSSNIDKVYINLYAYSPYGTLAGHEGTSNSTYLRQVKDAWTESGITWANQPGTDTTAQVILPQSTSAAQNYVKIDVTNLVKSMIDKNRFDNGFLIQLVNETPKNALVFRSKDCSHDTSIWPKLVVHYKASATVSDIQKIQTCKLYPNPASNSIRISMLESFKPETIAIYSVTGNLIASIPKTEIPNGETINIDLNKLNITAGSYFIKLISNAKTETLQFSKTL